MRQHKSPGYNWIFNEQTGEFLRWGERLEVDPQLSPVGNEIADIEISTTCHGINGTPCKFCYKSNGPAGEYMPLNKFIDIFHKLPRNVTQIAFGIGDIDSNPDIWKIFEYCRKHDVVPNVTINGDRMDPIAYMKLAELCGAVAVSMYEPKDVCYNAVYQLSEVHGMKQVNIHKLVSEETYDSIQELMSDMSSDKRLAKLNAVVLLSLKQKGRGGAYHRLGNDKFKSLIDKMVSDKLRFGFDSCTAHKFLEAVKDKAQYNTFQLYAEPCESTLFSIYINVKGIAYPCSFVNDEEFAVDLAGIDNFILDVWFNEAISKFRKKLLDSGRKCPVYEI